MIDPLLRKSLADLRVQVLGWGLGVGGLLFVTVLFYPSVSSAYGDIWEKIPKEWLAFFGGGSLDTLEGYLNLEFFSYAPLVLAVFAILAGTAALFVDVRVSAGRIMGAFALLWPFETAVAYLSVLLSLALSGRLLAGSLVAILLAASYILDSLANLVSGLEPLRPLFPTVYYQGSRALVAEISWSYIAGLLGAIGVALALSLLLFHRRDIGVRATLSFFRILAPGRRRGR